MGSHRPKSADTGEAADNIMGLDNSALTFVLGSKSAGVDFDRTVMLGRQNFFPSATHFHRTMEKFAPSARLDEILAASSGYAEPFFQLLGATEVVSIDASSYEGASLIHDLNDPIPSDWKGRFTAVVDGGSLDHVFDFPRALRNATELLAVGGHFLSIAPANNFMGHGFYQFSPELYFRAFVPANGFRLRVLLIQSCSSRSRWYRVLDPESVRGRVELRNGLPTLLYVLAQKVDEQAFLTLRPQQSDYSAVWQTRRDAETGATPRTIGQRLPTFLKRPLQRLLPLLANSPFNVKSRCYQWMKEDDILSGNF